MPGYSDAIDHAFSFTAKHSLVRPQGPAARERQANVAVILARHQADEATIVASIVCPLIEERAGRERQAIEEKIMAKFGPEVFVAALDATEPRNDPKGRPRSWRPTKQAMLGNLTQADTRALSVVTANELHWCGWGRMIARRLGPEYLPVDSAVTAADILWWHQSLIEVLHSRVDWQNLGMAGHLREAADRLQQALAQTP